jgi:hypothetical protein
VKFDLAGIARAIRNELARGGQVFRATASNPSSIGHMVSARARSAGRRRPRADGRGHLERAMLDFVAKFDVLLATTIVENGPDIPRPTPSSSTGPIGMACGSISSAGASAVPIARVCPSLIPPEDNLSPVAKNGSRDQGARGPRKRLSRGRSTSRSAAPAICWAATERSD